MNVPEVYLGDTSLIIATYNEEESLSFVLEEIQNYNFGDNRVVETLPIKPNILQINIIQNFLHNQKRLGKCCERGD